MEKQNKPKKPNGYQVDTELPDETENIEELLRDSEKYRNTKVKQL